MNFISFFLLPWFLLILSKFSTVQGQPSSTRTASMRVGESAPADRFPYVCSLRQRGSRDHVCSGTLIHPEWIVTSARCIDPNYPDSAGLDPVVYCNTHDLNNADTDAIYTAVEGILHEKWNGNVGDGFDIALLRLDQPTRLALPVKNVIRDGLDDRAPFTALSWDRASATLQIRRHLPFVAHKRCNPQWNGVVQKDKSVCVFDHPETCAGGSGDPLFVVDAPSGNLPSGLPQLDLLVGILSFGPTCGPAGRPAVYTSVGYYTKWIENAISNSVSRPKPAKQRPSTTSSTKKLPSTPELLQVRNPTLIKPCMDTDATVVQRVVNAIEKDDVATVRSYLNDGLDSNSIHNDPSALYGGTSDDTLLHWAARYNAPKCARVLISFGAKPNAKNAIQNAPLHYCGLFGGDLVIRVLLDAGVGINTRGLDDHTALHYASWRFHTSAVKVLISLGANVNAKNSDGETPLHEVAWAGHPPVAEVLLRNGADVNIKDNDGETPLHDASEHGHVHMVQIFLDAGASKAARTVVGSTPMDLVCRTAYPPCDDNRRSTIIELLTL